MFKSSFGGGWPGTALTFTVAMAASFASLAAADEYPYPATPGVACDAESNPEGDVQGFIPAEDRESGRFFEGYWCNVRQLAHVRPQVEHGDGGGFRVERYVDANGRECAYYDTTPLFPSSRAGVQVLDMSQYPPVRTANLRTPAMLTPHESMRVNQERGLLVAVMGNPVYYPGVIDIYDISEDCRNPVLQASTPLGILGHESGFSPDGLTYWAATSRAVTAVDLTDPTSPQFLYTTSEWPSHGVSLSDDGRTMFMGGGGGEGARLFIIDVSEIQDREPDPQARELSQLGWPEASIPQNATPFTSGGHDYVIETDEFGGGGGPVGAARIINVDDLTAPFVVSRLRLEMHNQEDGGWTAHYCEPPTRVNPAIIACGMLASGLRVFDIRDPHNPVEVAYANYTNDFGTIFNQTSDGELDSTNGNVYAAPAYDLEENAIWYTDTQRGFYAVQLTEASGITSFTFDPQDRGADTAATPAPAAIAPSVDPADAAPMPNVADSAPTATTPAVTSAESDGAGLPATGGGAVGVGLGLLLLAAAVRRRRSAVPSRS